MKSKKIMKIGALLLSLVWFILFIYAEEEVQKAAFLIIANVYLVTSGLLANLGEDDV